MEVITTMLFVVFVIHFVEFAETSPWSYHERNGPSEWSGLCHDGHQQSPVDIVAIRGGYGMYGGRGLQPLDLSSYSSIADMDLKLLNNGHTVKLQIPSPSLASISGGSLPSSEHYYASQFHFHWGQDDTHGSEHTINGQAFPLEMHVVHYSSKYSSLAGAADQDHGLAVVSVMFEIGRHNPNLASITDHLMDINSEGLSSFVSAKLINLIPSDTSDYYSYYGSLTTPPCYESVIWTILGSHIQLSSSQMAEFRKLLAHPGEKLGDNFRPVQPLNGRAVVHHSTGGRSGYGFDDDK